MAPEADLPALPSVDAYHRELHLLASRLSPRDRQVVAGFLAAAAECVDRATEALPMDRTVVGGGRVQPEVGGRGRRRLPRTLGA